MRTGNFYRTKKKFYIVITVIAFLFICAALYCKTQELKKEEEQVTLQLEKAQSKYDAEVERTDEIEERRAYVQTKRFAEEVAREKFGMVYGDEIIFTPKN